MAHEHQLQVGGHLVVVRAEPASDGGGLFTLSVDGRMVAEQRSRWRDPNWRLADLDTGIDLDRLGLREARVRGTSWRTGRLSGVRLELPSVTGHRERIRFTPPADTRARRRHEWAEAHPRAHAARHVAGAIGQILVGLIGVSLVIGVIPWGALPLPQIPWPDIDLPSLPRPDLPAIPWPDWTLPGWLRAIRDSSRYWLPVVIALVVAVNEYRRRRRRRSEGVGGIGPGSGGGPPPERP